LKKLTNLLLSGLLLIVLIPLALAQQGTILHLRGHITDSQTRADVAGVRVSALEARHSTTTDANGLFSLELRDEIKPGADVRIHVQKEGYRADDVTLAASENVTAPIRISRLGRRSIPTPTLELSLALITTIYRMKEKQGGYTKGGQNDLIGVLRVRQRNGTNIRHVRSIQVTGKAYADFNLWMLNFSKGDGSESMDDLEAVYMKCKPFLRLSWVLYPRASMHVDQNDEEFVRLPISQSMGALDFEGDPRSYFGCESTNTEPRYPMTSQAWYLIVQFTGAKDDLNGIRPTLRDDVKTGKVKVQANVDGEIIDIPLERISFPWAVSLNASFGDEMLTSMSDQELFYGIDRGRRTALPSSRDPLVVEPKR